MKMYHVVSLLTALAVFGNVAMLLRRLFYRVDKQGQPTRRVAYFGLTEKEIMNSIFSGVLAGLATYLIVAPVQKDWSLVLSFIVSLGVIVAMCYVAAYWKREGDRAAELFWFLLLEIILLIVSIAGMRKAAEMFAHPFVAECTRTLPWIVLVGTVGYMLYCYFDFRATDIDYEDDRPEEEQDADSEFHGNCAQWAAAIAIVLILGIVLSVLIAHFMFPKPVEATEPEPEPVAALELDERFMQAWVGNNDTKVDDRFREKLNERAVANGGVITPEMVRDELLNICGHDARILAIWGYTFDLWSNPNLYEPLLVRDDQARPYYLSDEGIDLYRKVEDYLKNAKIVRELAPADGYNSEYSGGQYVEYTNPGVGGDRTGTKITGQSGKETWVMDRCANIVTKKDPADDPSNNGNADKGGGDNLPTDGAGEEQPTDPRTTPAQVTPNANGEVTPENNNHGHIDPEDVVPETPPVVEEHKKEEEKGQIVDREEKMNYGTDSVIDSGSANPRIDPTPSSEGAGEFTPDD